MKKLITAVVIAMVTTQAMALPANTDWFKFHDKNCQVLYFDEMKSRPQSEAACRERWTDQCVFEADDCEYGYKEHLEMCRNQLKKCNEALEKKDNK